MSLELIKMNFCSGYYCNGAFKDTCNRLRPLLSVCVCRFHLFRRFWNQILTYKFAIRAYYVMIWLPESQWDLAAWPGSSFPSLKDTVFARTRFQVGKSARGWKKKNDLIFIQKDKKRKQFKAIVFLSNERATEWQLASRKKKLERRIENS